MSVDPISKDYPELSTYQFASNTPIWAIDIDGLEAGLYGAGTTLSVAEKHNSNDFVNGFVKWANSPATPKQKLGLAYQISYSQVGVPWEKVYDDNLTQGGYYLQTFLQSNLSYQQSKPGNLKIPNTRQPQKPQIEVPVETSKPKQTVVNAETITVTRVQTTHKLSQRISVNEAGDISITGTTKLYITLDDQNHATYYYNKKGGSEGGASIVSFQVTKKVADEIRNMAVPQEQAKANPTRPEIADPTKSNSAYGLPANYIDKLQAGAVKGTGKIETP